MKRLSVLFSLMLLAALVLSACGGANTGTEGTPGAVGTPGAGAGLETPATGLETPADVVETPADVMETPDAAATDEGELAETPGTDDITPVGGATPAADLTGTPAAEVPVTGAETCTPNRLSTLFDYEVRDMNGEELGEVDGLVILRDASVTVASTPAAAGAEGTTINTPAAGTPGADAAGTPAAEGEAAAGSAVNPMIQPGVAPKVGYLIVDFDDAGDLGDRDGLVPFTAFQPLSVDTAVEDCAFTMTVDTTGIADSPALVENDNWPDFTTEGWSQSINEFWTELGVMDPAVSNTGAQMANPIVLRDSFDDIEVENLDGDDLGEIEEFVLDPATGEFQYAVLAAGGFLGLGEKYIPVPMSKIGWGNVDEDDDDLGEMVIDVPEETWQTAPSFDTIDIFDTTTENWDTEIENFWNTQVQ